jgi:hypothetical protein
VTSWAIHNGVIAARRTSESIGQSPLNFGATSRYQESATTNIATGEPRGKQSRSSSLRVLKP